MSDSTRRGFLAATAVAGAGAAATVALVSAPSAGAVTPSETRRDGERHTLPSGADGSMAAFVDDVHSGEITVMVRGREVVVHDEDLVARLAHAVAGATND